MKRPASIGATGLTILATLALTVAVSAQFPAPAGWKWVTDADAKLITALDPPPGSWLFGTMAPGWHITTRPAVTLFEPSYTTRGRFAVESETFLFPGTSPSGFGLFAAGHDLDSKGRFVAFLIRRDGSAAIEAIDAGRTTVLHPWTKAASILPGAAAADARNVLRIEAEATSVAFLVNGEKVADVARDGNRFDGIVGLRVGADLNLHITNLDITHKLALPRRARQP